jgi:hypothetical protein
MSGSTCKSASQSQCDGGIVSRLIIKTEESLYKPVEVEIDGQVYQVARVTRSIQRQLLELDEAWKRGELDAAFLRLEVLIGPQEFIEKLDVQQANAITEYIVRKVYAPSKEDRAEEKKASEAGETPSS